MCWCVLKRISQLWILVVWTVLIIEYWFKSQLKSYSNRFRYAQFAHSESVNCRTPINGIGNSKRTDMCAKEKELYGQKGLKTSENGSESKDWTWRWQCESKRLQERPYRLMCQKPLKPNDYGVRCNYTIGVLARDHNFLLVWCSVMNQLFIWTGMFVSSINNKSVLRIAPTLTYVSYINK